MRAQRKNHSSDEHTGGHFERPWVWVMIDAFFLITAFFVSTFHLKVDENVLPQRLSAGPIKPTPNPIINDVRAIRVHVTHEGGVAQYQYHSVKSSLADLTASLTGARSTGNVQVRVSYDSGVPFGDVMAVMNASTRAGIKDVGLSPIRVRS